METRIDLSDQAVEITFEVDATGHAELRLEGENGDVIILCLDDRTFWELQKELERA